MNPNHFISETAKYRHLTMQYCLGVGVDIASQGDAVVGNAISFDLPLDEFNVYCSNQPAKGPIHLRGHGDKLPFESGTLDFVYSSHLLEDYLDWQPVLSEWVRVLKPGGNLIVLIPDKERWAQAMANGQTPNCSHKHEGSQGEISTYCADLGVQVIRDECTNQFEGDYTILFVGVKK